MKLQNCNLAREQGVNVFLNRSVINHLLLLGLVHTYNQNKCRDGGMGGGVVGGKRAAVPPITSPINKKSKT